jgi:hypothetical protein
LLDHRGGIITAVFRRYQSGGFTQSVHSSLFVKQLENCETVFFVKFCNFGAINLLAHFSFIKKTDLVRKPTCVLTHISVIIYRSEKRFEHKLQR